jgi:hypothetical protein
VFQTKAEDMRKQQTNEEAYREELYNLVDTLSDYYSKVGKAIMCLDNNDVTRRMTVVAMLPENTDLVSWRHVYNECLRIRKTTRTYAPKAEPVVCKGQDLEGIRYIDDKWNDWARSLSTGLGTRSTNKCLEDWVQTDMKLQAIFDPLAILPAFGYRKDVASSSPDV